VSTSKLNTPLETPKYILNANSVEIEGTCQTASKAKK